MTTFVSVTTVEDDELQLLRWRLANLAERRLVAGLSPAESATYTVLCRREAELLGSVPDRA